jgi:hypothetical protein
MAVHDTAAILYGEPFSPVLTIEPSDDLGDLLLEANSLAFGLAGYVVPVRPPQPEWTDSTICTRCLAWGILFFSTFAKPQSETPEGLS